MVAARTPAPARRPTRSCAGGVAVELVHLGSLYHDDVMDEAVTRRSVESVNARWGNLQAILAGDFLLARASEIAASLGTEVAGLLARTIGRLCEGQIARAAPRLRLGRGPRRATSRRSTARRRRCSPPRAASAASSPTCPATAIDALTELGHAYGMVFQIVDDILDLTATDEQLGKPAGHDLVEGVYTLPVIRTLAAGRRRRRRSCGDLLGRPLDGAEVEKALAIVRSNGGVAEAVEVGTRYVARAEDACRGLPDGPATDALRAAPGALLASVAA